jgi:hypothetical protein
LFNRRRRGPESGFAVLFVYAMAATVAIMLYMELPRVAFEAQRDKEQLLIDRGEQYSRAVTLFVRKFNRYPADFDALQSTQNLRFLRHKYVDPMTGKDDWRLIHVGPGGVFTDSLVYGKKKKDDKQTEAQSFITEMQQTGGNQTAPGPQGVNLATRQRQSDQPGAPGDPNNAAQPGTPQLDASGQPMPNNPNNPNGNGTTPNANNGPVMVLPDGRIVPVSQGFPQPGTQQPGIQQPGIQQPGIQQPGIQQPGIQQPGFPAPFPQPGQQQSFPTGIQGQQGGFPGQQTPQQPNAPPTGAANLINQILTTPRPGGFNGLPGQPQPTLDQNGNPVPNANAGAFGTNPSQGNSNTGTALAPMGGQTVGGGIAGVASKLEQDGIKLYKDRTPYNEWEFVYDVTKDTSRAGAAQAQAGTQAAGASPSPGTSPLPGTIPTASPATTPSPPPASTGVTPQP